MWVLISGSLLGRWIQFASRCVNGANTDCSSRVGKMAGRVCGNRVHQGHNLSVLEENINGISFHYPCVIGAAVDSQVIKPWGKSV